ncbi:hypothetical protein, partial [Clostridium perfringens]
MKLCQLNRIGGIYIDSRLGSRLWTLIQSAMFGMERLVARGRPILVYAIGRALSRDKRPLFGYLSLDIVRQ